MKIECEGTDGAGKTTALKYLIQKLQNAGSTVVETREVGNPHIPVCVKLRELVLDPNSNMTGEAMELVFAAMRFMNDSWLKTVENTVDFVVSDRGWLSHLAYTEHNCSRTFVVDFYEAFVEQYTSLPDVVIYFKVDTETALQRRVKRGTGMDVIEMKGVEYQEKVRKSFDQHLEVYKTLESFKIFEVDANQSIEGVQKQMDKIATELLLMKAAGWPNA
jgi:dTMP kinase